MAVIIPIEDFKRYFEDEDIELYTDGRIDEFLKEDKLTSRQISKVKKLLSRA